MTLDMLIDEINDEINAVRELDYHGTLDEELRDKINELTAFINQSFGEYSDSTLRAEVDEKDKNVITLRVHRSELLELANIYKGRDLASTLRNLGELLHSDTEAMDAPRIANTLGIDE